MYRNSRKHIDAAFENVETRIAWESNENQYTRCGIPMEIKYICVRDSKKKRLILLLYVFLSLYLSGWFNEQRHKILGYISDVTQNYRENSDILWEKIEAPGNAARPSKLTREILFFIEQSAAFQSFHSAIFLRSLPRLHFFFFLKIQTRCSCRTKTGRHE